MLRSVTHRQIDWPAGAPLRAVCLIGGHTAPAPGCACGFHAAADLATLRQESLCLTPGEPLVVGRADLWGTVVVDDHGLRAEYARPSHLFLVTTPTDVDASTAAALAALAAYDVPVGTMPAEQAVGDVAAAILRFQAMSG